MEVKEMDVTITTNTPYSIPRSIDGSDGYRDKFIGEKNPDVATDYPQQDSINDKVLKEAMMNLQDVQNFLYMIIGSRLRIESNHNTPGTNINTCA
jgi:hypothetical protein